MSLGVRDISHRQELLWGRSFQSVKRDQAEEGTRGAVANVLDRDIVVKEFEIQSLNNVYFWTNFLGKGKNHQILSGTIYQPLRSSRIWHKVNF